MSELSLKRADELLTELVELVGKLAQGDAAAQGLAQGGAQQQEHGAELAH